MEEGNIKNTETEQTSAAGIRGETMPENEAGNVSEIKESRMVTGVLWQQLLLFFVPLLAGTFFQLLYNTVDAIIVGQFIGKEALSAVGGATATLINLFVGFFVGITSGETVAVSQFYGARRTGDVRKSVHTGMAIAVWGGVILTVVVGGLAEIMLEAMSTPADTLEWSTQYLRIYAAGMIGNMVYNMAASILRAVGDSRRPFLYLVAGTLTNVVLDCLFVIAFHWGVAGAAFATILSQYISAVLALIYLSRTTECFHISFRRIRLDPVYVPKILRIGIPAALQSLMYSFSNVLIQVAVNGFGTDTVAAWTVWGKVDSIFWMIIGSLGLATTTVVGQNFGAGKYGRVRKCAREAYLITFLFTASMSTFFYTLRDPLVRIFTSDPDVVRLGVEIAGFMAPTFLTYFTIEILSGTLRGMGDALIPTLITVLGVCGARIVWLFTAVAANTTMKMVMYCYPISWSISTAAFIFYYFYYVRKHQISEDRAAA